MLKMIFKRKENVEEPAKLGQVRVSSTGRVILVIENEKYNHLAINHKSYKVLVLREGRSGYACKFTTVPREYGDLDEIARDYPRLVEAELFIDC